MMSACERKVRVGQGAVFQVAGVMQSNACGALAPSSARTLDYRVAIEVDRNALTWKIPSSAIEARGAHDATRSSFQLLDDRTLLLRQADRRLQIAACVVRRIDLIEGTLRGRLLPLETPANDGGGAIDDSAVMSDASDGSEASDASDAGASDASASGPPAFTASETVGWAVVPGADCRDLIGVGSGQFIQLPCEQRWSLEGSFHSAVPQ